jgi:hypothetical protein
MADVIEMVAGLIWWLVIFIPPIPAIFLFHKGWRVLAVVSALACYCAPPAAFQLGVELSGAQSMAMLGDGIAAFFLTGVLCIGGSAGLAYALPNRARRR